MRKDVLKNVIAVYEISQMNYCFYLSKVYLGIKPCSDVCRFTFVCIFSFFDQTDEVLAFSLQLSVESLCELDLA